MLNIEINLNFIKSLFAHIKNNAYIRTRLRKGLGLLQAKQSVQYPIGQNIKLHILWKRLFII